MRTRTSRALWACLMTASALLVAIPNAAATAPDPVGGPLLTGSKVIVNAPADVPAPPDVGDGAWLIADATTGQVVATCNPHAPHLPASTIKVLTALVLLPRVAPTRTIAATAEDVAADGTRVGMVTGLSYTADELYRAMLMSSANDATYALARLGGGRAQTTAEMNKLATHLGALDTVVGDPSGLDAPGQQTSAYDLALIGRAALAQPALMTYAQTLEATFPGNPIAGSTEREGFAIGNHNALLTTYPGGIGLKNGWTTQARRTYIGAATRDGRTYLVTELAGENAGSSPTAQLLDWAFTYGDRVSPVGRLVSPGEVTPTATAAQPGASAAVTIASQEDAVSEAVPTRAHALGATTASGDQLVSLLTSWSQQARVMAGSLATSTLLGLAVVLVVVGFGSFTIGRCLGRSDHVGRVDRVRRSALPDPAPASRRASGRANLASRTAESRSARHHPSSARGQRRHGRHSAR